SVDGWLALDLPDRQRKEQGCDSALHQGRFRTAQPLRNNLPTLTTGGNRGSSCSTSKSISLAGCLPLADCHRRRLCISGFIEMAADTAVRLAFPHPGFGNDAGQLALLSPDSAR